MQYIHNFGLHGQHANPVHFGPALIAKSVNKQISRNGTLALVEG